jgi:hypothetical protein
MSIQVTKLSWNMLKNMHSRWFGDNCLDMGQERHSSVHNHSMSRMTYMRSWKSLRLTSHTWLQWLGLNPQIERPLSRIVVPLVYFFIFIITPRSLISSILSNAIWLIEKTNSMGRMLRRKVIDLHLPAFRSNLLLLHHSS